MINKTNVLLIVILLLIFYYLYNLGKKYNIIADKFMEKSGREISSYLISGDSVYKFLEIDNTHLN